MTVGGIGYSCEPPGSKILNVGRWVDAGADKIFLARFYLIYTAVEIKLSILV